MRPPSYYTSIAYHNNHNVNSNYGGNSAYGRTTSRDLRSSIASPSSTAYASRTHLPYAAQTTLVAHCFTGPGSTTRPYINYTPPSSSSSSSSSLSSGSSLSPANSHYSRSYTSHYSTHSRPSSTKRTSSSPVTSSLALSSSSSSSSQYLSPTSSYQSSASSASSLSSGSYTPLPRPSYLSPSSTTATSARSAYSRPSSASSYYKPIRLRERPLLTQISRTLNNHSPDSRPIATTTSASTTRPTTARTTAETTATSGPTVPQAELHGRPQTKGTQEAAPEDVERAPDAQNLDEANWSSDVARNISRNKYLIKFREFDKQHGRPSLAQLDAGTLGDDHYVDGSVDISGQATGKTESKQEQTLITNINDDDDDDDHKTDVRKPRGIVEEQTTDIELSLRPTKINCDTTPLDTTTKSTLNSADATAPATAVVTGSAPATGGEDKDGPNGAQKDGVAPETPVKPAKRRNIKLKLKPIGASKETRLDETERKNEKEDTSSSKPKVRKLIKKSSSKTIQDQANIITNVVDQNDAKQKEPKVDTKTSADSKPLKQLNTNTNIIESIDKPTTTTTNNNNTTTNKCLDATVEQEKKKKVKNKQANEKKLTSQQQKPDPSLPIVSTKATATTTPKLAQTNSTNNSNNINEISTNSNGTKRIRFREYNYDDFNFLSVLGHGGWGFVILAELKDHDACFAVKCIKKITIVEDDDFDSIMIERKVLTLGNVHPFICKLFCTFETEGYLFFVMEYCAGGDLMFHVQNEGKFSESRCRFYASEIICAIRFLHNRHIIYRDLKLDNILLDSSGHIRLVDFGMCQCRTYREEMLPSNFCGTPEYISPEIIKGVPYNHSVDWWSFGVLLYEMAVGKMPFRGSDENELLWNVCYEQIHYPMFLSKELTSLLQLLLEREPSKRMGMATCKAGDIYEQPFFRSVDWKAVEELRVKPPFVPEVASKRDVSNFDSDFTESACELSPVDESTLARIDQTQFQKFPYTNPSIDIFDSMT